jgi:hypothetical protein
MTGLDEAIEHGAVRADCTRCAYRDTLLASDRCRPGDACLMVENGRQIDRFLRRN